METNHIALTRIKDAMFYLVNEHQKILRLAIHYIEAKMIVNQVGGDFSLPSLVQAVHPHLAEDKRKMVSAMMMFMAINKPSEVSE